jgi:hypothetical protein
MSQGYQKISESVAPNNPSENVLHHYGFGVKITPALASLLTFLFTVFLVLAAYLSKTLTDENRGCLGPPFLYISHHQSKNLLKYTRDGCSVSKDVLWYGGSVFPASSLRDIVIHPYRGEKDALYVANAGETPKEAPKVLVFGSCSPWNGMRTYMDTIVTKDSSAGAQHTYSLTFDDSGNLYVSFQHTDAVLRFWNGSFRPMPNAKNFTYYNDIHTNDVVTGETNSASASSSSIANAESASSQHEPEASLAEEGINSGGGLQLLHKSKYPSFSPAPSISAGDNGSPIQVPTNAFNEPTAANNNGNGGGNGGGGSGGGVTSPSTSPTSSFISPPYPSKKFKTDPPSVPAVQKIDTSNYRYYEGTFVQFGAPGFHNDTTQGVRAVRWIKSTKQMWIANENLNHVLIVDSHGYFVDKIKIKNPIGMHVDEDRHSMVFIGSKKTSKYSGAVYGVDIQSR